MKGVGEETAKKFHKLKIFTIFDLLYHFPAKYNQFKFVEDFSNLKLGENVCVNAKVIKIFSRKTKTFKDLIIGNFLMKSGNQFVCEWFNQTFIRNNFKSNMKVTIYGKFSKIYSGIGFSNPKISFGHQKFVGKKMIPIYPETDKLSSHTINKIALEILKNIEIPEILNSKILQKEKFPERFEAIKNLHFGNLENLKISTERIKFEELYFFLKDLRERKKKFKSFPAKNFFNNEKVFEEFQKSLQFELTKDQKNSIKEILKDLKKKSPMLRMLQGETGSGKTIVGIFTTLLSQKNGYRTILICPTNVLAQQHFETAKKILKKFGIKISLISGKKNECNFAEGKIGEKEFLESDFIIGTQALLFDKVSLENVALILIDEEQKLGVNQRKKLIHDAMKINGFAPHTLSMTATPIPRTSSLLKFSVYDISFIKEFPQDRKEVKTKVFTENSRAGSIEFLKLKLLAGDQAIVVFPLISESEFVDAKSLEVDIADWEKNFQNFKIGFVHGKLKSAEQEEIFENFRNKKIDILLATTMIEIGVDFPNLTTIWVENSERFGLSTLHQLRGRVGRGEKPGFALFFTKTLAGYKKLKFLENTYNGYEIAMKDLKNRGPGDLLGLLQSGVPNFKLADFSDDNLMKKVANWVDEKL
ncbi:MAG: ATP-dependent DNA helicase RecG [Patescibacteria group bacterium]